MVLPFKILLSVSLITRCDFSTGSKLGQVLIHGPDCASCMVGRKCQILITIEEPSNWINVRLSQQRTNSTTLTAKPHPGSSDSDVSDGPVHASAEDDIMDDEAWWSNDVTMLLTGPSKLFADVTCKNPPHCSKLEAGFTAWDAGEYR